MEDLFSYRLSLLQKEMEMLQNAIRGYYSILFTIKGWAITAFSAIILFAVDKQKPFLYLLCIASVLSFWWIDAFYKSTQNILISRYGKIEVFLRGADFEKAMTDRNFGSFLIPHFAEGFNVMRNQRLRSLFQAAFQFHTFLLYAFLLILVIGTAITTR